MSPFKDIWLNTGRCIDYYLLPANRKSYFLELVWIAGITNGILLFLNSNSELKYFYILLFPVTVVMILRFFLPWILLKTGKLVNGKGTIDDLRLIISLSAIPTLLNLSYLILSFIIPGDQKLENDLIDFIVWVVNLRVLIIGVAKVQKVSYILAFMNIFIPQFILIFIYLVFSQ